MTPSAPEAAVEIHGYVNCPFAWRPRLAAAEKGIRFAWIPCDVDHPDPRAAEHNPDEHSPLLHHDGFELLESAVIAQYLDEGFPGRTLMPADPHARAALRWLATRLEGMDVHTEPSRPLARRKSELPLRLLDRTLDGRSYLHGAEPGLIDILVLPFLANVGVRGLLDAEAYPQAADYLARFAARPSFVATRPPWAASL